MKKDRLPDTPWHVGYTKKEEDDPRRDRRKCIHYKQRKCTYGRSGAYTMNCPGSSHCKFYAETEKQWEDVYKQTRTREQEIADNIKKHKIDIIGERMRIINDTYNAVHSRSFNKIHYCVLCLESLEEIRNGRAKRCNFCNTIYSRKNDCISSERKITILLK